MNNNQKLREALEKIIEIVNKEWDSFRETSAMWEIHEIGTDALAARPRNCDRFNNTDELVAYYGDDALKEAWRELREKIKNCKYEFAIELVLMIDWLFAEAKGEMK